MTIKYYSYVLVAAVMILVGWFGMGTPLITVLFSYFVMTQLLAALRKRWIAALVFCLLVVVLGSGLAFFLAQAWKTLPGVAERALPAFIHYAQSLGVEPTFTDWDGLKAFLGDLMKSEFYFLGNFAKIASKQLVLLIIGLVIAVSLFLNPTFFLNPKKAAISNAYAVFCEEASGRFRSLYISFARVMGAQMLISAINTSLTAIFLLSTHFPHIALVIVLTFLFGLLPIVGNLLSNSLIVSIAFTVSPQLAVWSLVFLVVIHKLEYFLNSKIIGDRIKNPVWLTLIGLIIGERLMGIAGMILAPVLLHYIRAEASLIEVADSTGDPPPEKAAEGAAAPTSGQS